MPRDISKLRTKRRNQTLISLWVGDAELTQWLTAMEVRGMSSLSKFVRESVNMQIALGKVEAERVVTNKNIQEEIAHQKDLLASMNVSLETKIEEIKNAFATRTADNVPLEANALIIRILKVASRPLQWEELVEATALQKADVLAALQSLFQQGLLTMTKEGAWTLSE